MLQGQTHTRRCGPGGAPPPICSYGWTASDADAHQGLGKRQTHLRVIREAANAIPVRQAAGACVALLNFFPGSALVRLP